MNEKRFNEIEVRMIMEQILLVLDFFQRKQIVHRDIKPDNILIKSIKDEGVNYEIKVADLGLAISTPNDHLLYLKCGTPGYIAPEIFTSSKNMSNSGYSYKADIFSAGSLFFNLLTGCYVFSGDGNEGLIFNNMKCGISHIVPHIQRFTPLCQELLMLMLSKDTCQRPTAASAL
jgi:serine/threonine protein kinase